MTLRLSRDCCDPHGWFLILGFYWKPHVAYRNKTMCRKAVQSASLYHRKWRHSYSEIGPSSVVGRFCFVKKFFNLSSFCCDAAKAGWSNVSEFQLESRDKASAMLFCLPGTYLISIFYSELWDKIPVSKFTWWALLAIVYTGTRRRWACVKVIKWRVSTMYQKCYSVAR